MAQRTLSMNSLKAPVRPAPPPPSSIAKANSTSHMQHAVSSSNKTAPPRPEEPKKKIAPPRPPPPKALNAQLKAVQSAIAFTGMLQPKKQNQIPLTSSVTAPDLLINWDSPPTSPTPGRSSSGDGLSLKSFGSDSSGTTANGAFSTMTRSESGFESEPDAWSESAVSVAAPVSRNENLKPFNMPTIIRPNRSAKPPPPATQAPSHLKVLEKITSSIPMPVINHPRSSSPYLADLLDLDVSECTDNSPPEPSIPPPAPPSFLLTSSPNASASSPPPSLELDLSEVPSAVALFDYQSSHSGDLNFKEGDRILLIAQVNDEWLRGSIGNSEGMFPVSFVRVEVPLERKSTDDSAVVAATAPASSTYRAVALYAFDAETSHDLSLQEGDIVLVTESLGNGWLYGEDCRSGRRGQFPESFVRRDY